MVGLTREQRAARKAAADALAQQAQAEPAKAAQDPAGDTPQAQAEPGVLLVSVTKAGEVLDVHPLCLDAHIRIGWAPC